MEELWIKMQLVFWVCWIDFKTCGFLKTSFKFVGWKYLVVGINEGCTQLPAFLEGSKVYYGNCVFGRATDTYNNEGQTTMEKPYGTLL